MIRYRPILEGSPGDDSAGPSPGGWEPSVRDTSVVSSSEPPELPRGGWEPSVSGSLCVSFIARSLTTTRLSHGRQAEPLSHPEWGWRRGAKSVTRLVTRPQKPAGIGRQAHTVLVIRRRRWVGSGDVILDGIR